jgi:hypothetical protein
MQYGPSDNGYLLDLRFDYPTLVNGGVRALAVNETQAVPKRHTLQATYQSIFNLFAQEFVINDVRSPYSHEHHPNLAQ